MEQSRHASVGQSVPRGWDLGSVDRSGVDGQKNYRRGARRRVHRTVFRNSIQRERLEELTFVGPDAAVVRFYSTLTGDERSPNEVVRSRKILMVTRRDGLWRVGWGQNTRLAASTPD